MRMASESLACELPQQLPDTGEARGVEHRLLLACAASELSAARLAQITALAERRPDWNAITARAWNHGIVPLVYRQLAAIDSTGAVPQHVLADLGASATAIAAANLRLASALLELVRSLEAVGVRTISYKGPTLAMRAYGNLALRHYNDLDVLIHRHDMRAAAAALVALGYRLHDPVGQPAERAALQWGHHFSFLRQPDTLVEIHWRFHKPLFGSPLPEEEVWRAASGVDVAGQRIRTLSTQHELLVLATHGSWHGWSQLSWVCDVAELLGRTPDLDFAELLDAGRRFGIMRPLLLAFDLTHALLGAELPAAVVAAVTRESAVRRASFVIERRIRSGAVPGYESARLQLTLRERARDKAAFALRAMFQPNPADLRAVHLPAPLFPLYYAIRPIRVALKYRPRGTRTS